MNTTGAALQFQLKMGLTRFSLIRWLPWIALSSPEYFIFISQHPLTPTNRVTSCTYHSIELMLWEPSLAT